MEIEKFVAGVWRSGYKYKYFLPETINHQWTFSHPQLQKKIESASFRLWELNSFSKYVPNIDLFLQSYVMKEAVTSSRIEWTKTNMEEAFSDELDISPEHRDDWKETIQYRESLNFAIIELGKIPLSNRLIKSIHQILLSHVRGKDKNPWEFRTSQNWIGWATLADASFIPPSHEHVADLMSDMEKFLHNEDIFVPYLIKIAIAHYQFETIHPFLDGNGRTGRLLIPLYLVSQWILHRPLLYVSDFFEKNKGLYYDKLTWVRERNDLLGWLMFFLEAVESTATEAIESLREIIALREDITRNEIPKLGRKAQSGHTLLETLFRNPITSARSVQEDLGLSAKAANDLISDFVSLGLLVEITGNKRNRIFSFRKYLDILKK